MGRYKNLLSIITLSVMVLGLSMVASAQWRNRRGNDDNYGRNNYNLNSTIKSLKNNSDRFEDVLDRELDRSRYDGSRREDNLNELAERFKNAAKKLDKEYKDNRGLNRSADEARSVISYGSQLDRALTRSRLTRDSYALQNSWAIIERDMITISRAYNIGYNGQYGRRNGRDGQYGRNDRNDDGQYGRNDRNNNRNNRNGRYGRNGNLRGTIVNLRNKSRRFEDRIDRERNDRNGRRNIGNLENLSNRFNDAVKDLEKEYNNARDYDDSYDEVQKVLRLGEQVDREVSQRGIDRDIRNDWNSIEQDLRTLASAYNLSYNGQNNRGYGIGDIFKNFPF